MILWGKGFIESGIPFQTVLNNINNVQFMNLFAAWNEEERK